jgi:hypothetical protein
VDSIWTRWEAIGAALAALLGWLNRRRLGRSGASLWRWLRAAKSLAEAQATIAQLEEDKRRREAENAYLAAALGRLTTAAEQVRRAIVVVPTTEAPSSAGPTASPPSSKPSSAPSPPAARGRS